MLRLKVNFDSDQGERRGRTGFNRPRFPTTSSTCSEPPPTVSTTFARRSATVRTPLEKTCFYCKNSGHFIADCPVLSKKHESYKPVALLKTVKNCAVIQDMDQPAQKSELPGSSSFLMDGCVSLVTDPSTKQPIKIWRDSGAFQSLILQDLLPFTDQSKLGSSALVQGFGGGVICLCLCIKLPLKLVLSLGK